MMMELPSTMSGRDPDAFQAKWIAVVAAPMPPAESDGTEGEDERGRRRELDRGGWLRS
jgi:hypothetical protein